MADLLHTFLLTHSRYISITHFTFKYLTLSYYNQCTGQHRPLLHCTPSLTLAVYIPSAIMGNPLSTLSLYIFKSSASQSKKVLIKSSSSNQPLCGYISQGMLGVILLNGEAANSTATLSIYSIKTGIRNEHRKGGKKKKHKSTKPFTPKPPNILKCKVSL